MEMTACQHMETGVCIWSIKIATKSGSDKSITYLGLTVADAPDLQGVQARSIIKLAGCVGGRGPCDDRTTPHEEKCG